MKEKIYEITTEFHRLDRRVPLALYKPTVPTERSQIAVLAMHGGDYMSFQPMIEMAKRGYIAAGANPNARGKFDWLKSYCACVNFLKNYPGVKKVVLMGHSQGGCMMSCYQYIAENGIDRFKNSDRVIPFPDMPALTPGDGLMLIDANYGIMDMLALDPGVKDWKTGYGRIPELDIYNPENGYKKDESEYSQEFIRRFQKAQVKMYKDIFAYALERREAIWKGQGAFADDEPVLIAGGAGGSNNNKLFIQDNRLLGRTREAHDLLHADGTITNEIIRTVRPREDAVKPEFYNRGAFNTTVMNILAGEYHFDDDFGYDECSMWGADGWFNPFSTRENVKYIHVPLLVQGNTASHEMVNTEFNLDAAVSSDVSSIWSEGSTHMFGAINSNFADPLPATADFFAQWIAKPGRFMD